MPTATDVTVVPAPATQVRQTLRRSLAAAHQSFAEAEQYAAMLADYARVMGLDLSRQWHAVQGGRIMASCTCIASPGRTDLLLIPTDRFAPPYDDAVRGLARQAVRDSTEHGCRLLQVLLPPGPGQTIIRRILGELGFIDVAELAYMERSVEGTPSATADSNQHYTAESVADGEPRSGKSPFQGAGPVSWVTYGPDRHQEFREVVGRTYAQSLDCPRLSGLREMEDILTGHKSAGLFEPMHWYLAMRSERAVGCILLNRNPLQPSLEIVYMGIVPEFRGRGLGGLMLRHGLNAAHREGMKKVTLAVDAANVPARSLYSQFGFSETARRRALVLPLNPTFD